MGFPRSSHLGDGVVLTELSTWLGGQKPDFGVFRLATQLIFELDPEHNGAVVFYLFSKQHLTYKMVDDPCCDYCEQQALCQFTS